MDWKLVLQIAGVVLGLLYLWLEYRADIRLWVVGLIMPLVHGALYYKAGLYADCSMQAYYVLAGLYGWIVWHNAPRRKAAADRIGHTPLRQAAGLIAVYAAAHTGIYFLLVGFTNSTVPFWDAMTTAASIVAISSIHLLRIFMNISTIENDKLLWYVIVHLTFVLSALVMCWIDLLTRKAHQHDGH